MRKYLAKLDWIYMLMNKTAIECWNILKYEIESIIDKFVPLKKQVKRSRKKHLSKEAIRKIVFKQTMWKVYRRTRKDEDYANYKEALKEARVGQTVLSGILPIMGGRGEEYRNCRRMAINTQVQKVCMEEGVGFVDMWLNFVGRGDFFMRDGLHLTCREGRCISWV